LQELQISAPKPRDLTDNEVINAMKEILERLGILKENIV
jgi:hypothetical protein